MNVFVVIATTGNAFRSAFSTKERAEEYIRNCVYSGQNSFLGNNLEDFTIIQTEVDVNLVKTHYTVTNKIIRTPDTNLMKIL